MKLRPELLATTLRMVAINRRRLRTGRKGVKHFIAFGVALYELSGTMWRARDHSQLAARGIKYLNPGHRVRCDTDKDPCGRSGQTVQASPRLRHNIAPVLALR